jgi:ubiquitin carboxyl-terminal hydrolase 34
MLATLLNERRIDVPAEARTTDLEEFFVAYGQLTIRFLNLDIHLMDQYEASGTFEKLSELYCRHYLPTLAMVLQYRDIPFYTLLHENRGFNAFDLVSTVCDRLSGNQDGILPTLTEFVARLAHVLPRKPAFTMVFVQALAVGNVLARSGTERMLLQASERSAPSPAIQMINHQVLDLCMKADDLLQGAISKQSPWLTIENSPDILRFLSRMFISISEQDADIAAQLTTYVFDKYPDTGPRELPEIIGYAWKFRTLRKYITAGRMELRVYGMDSMQIDLVHVWKCYAQYNPNRLSVPLVRFLVQFLRDNKMVQYIVGVDSHPQLITRSNNVVGFLVVTGTYCDEDSDIIWCTVKESQDPRTVSEVLTMLKLIFHMQSLPTLMHLCRKLLELPVERYDGKMNDYADALFLRIREHALSRPQQDEYLEAVPFEVCVRLIRDVIASKTCSPNQQRHLPSWAAEHLVRLLAFNINIEDKRRLWEQCVQDIAQKTRFATGSMRALQAWLEEHPDLEVPKLAHDFDFARLLIEELVDCLNRNQAETSTSTFLQILLPTRLCLLALIAQYAPDTLTEELTEQLWSNVLASRALDGCLSDMAWDIFSKVVTRCKKPNSMIQRLMTDYLPRLNADSLNERLLHFAENSVLYELQLEQPRDQEDRDVVSLPGINRVWRFVMECPTENVVNEATNWIIKQYLDHEVVLRCPRQVVESTHISLLERCLSEVFSAASKLKSLSDGMVSGEDEPRVVAAPEEAASAEVLRFTRSLLFLRQFLLGVKCRPRYSPTLSTESRLPDKPFQTRGEEVTIKYEVGAIPGRSTSSLQRKLVIGDENTVDELARYISDLTGFTQFTGVARGQIISLTGNQTTIKDSTVGTGLLLVQKVPDSPEKQPISVPPSASSMDAHVMDHFDEFYGLLDLDDQLSKEVYAFLELFPPQPRIIELIRSKRATVFQLLPTGKPYKLLYGLTALRRCVEEEALGLSPDEDFMIFSVNSIISVLNRSEAIETDKARGLLINHVLIDCLLLAMRAPVSLATFQAYFSNSTGLADRLVSLIFEVVESENIQEISIPSHMLVRQPFSVLMESALHDSQINAEMVSSDRVHSLIERTLLVDKRSEVRRAVADVLFGLTGQPVIKLVFQKSLDLRSARPRLSADKIEGFLAIQWKSLAEILPKSHLHPSTSQQLFDVSLAIFRIIGKSLKPEELTACFQKWASLLVSYDHHEVCSATCYIVPLN